MLKEGASLRLRELALQIVSQTQVSIGSDCYLLAPNSPPPSPDSSTTLNKSQSISTSSGQRLQSLLDEAWRHGLGFLGLGLRPIYIQDLIPGPGWFGIRVMLRKHNIQYLKGKVLPKNFEG